MQEKQKILEFEKDNEGIIVSFLIDGVQVADILLGVAATIKIVKEETSKNNEEILKVIKEMIEESEKRDKKEGEEENGSK